MKILVTGSNGYLGRGIVNKLLEDNIEVIATDFVALEDSIKCKYIRADLFDIADPYEYFDRPDVVLHLAWRNGFVHNASSHIEDLPKHVRFIDKMAQKGVSRIAVMGSMHEVGFYEGSIDENTVCHPMSYYGIAKDALRNVTSLICKNNNVTFQWLRGFYIVGTSKNGSSIFAKLIQASDEGKKTFPFTMGQNQFDFINYEDFCLQVAATVEQNEINGIINICEGKPEKLAERVERFIVENKLNISLQYGSFPDRPYDSKAIWGNDSKVKKILANRVI